jgi:hypothetical protein
MGNICMDENAAARTNHYKLDSQSNKDYATRIWHGSPTSYYMGNAISRVIS